MKKISLISILICFCFTGWSQADKKLNVAVFIHEGVQLLDFSGPAEVFSDVTNEKMEKLYNVYTVASSANEITSQGFLKVKPNYSIKDCPKPDIIILPGGATRIPLADKEVIDWIRTSSQTTQYLLSVCTGALLLAEAGVLDGKQATTHYCCQDKLATYTKVNVLRGVRYIDNGNVITTEGISAGIDGALYLVQKINGKESAKNTAEYMMYDWNPAKLKEVIAQKK